MKRPTVQSSLPRLILLALPLVATPIVGADSSCLGCHGDADLFDPEYVEILSDYREDIHVQAGLSCHDCHGGNPDSALVEDMDAAMDPEFAENPYRGAPAFEEIPGFCGRCHSDPTYMKRFKPDARVDQEAEYWTSQHGLALTKGDERVATCVSCHGVHGILSPANPNSWVYPTHVAETCRGCHADAERMATSTLPDGRPLPIDQFARWQQSVHAKSMYEKEDLSAPTCNDCHGNHGAAPPGLDSVHFVCGQCHGREAELFRDSPKSAAFELHNEFLAEAGEEGCAACHEAPEPQAGITGMRSFGECTACHGNHGIVRPTIGMFSPPPPTPCAFCHRPPETVELALEEPRKIQEHHNAVREELLAEAEAQGLEGEALYNWLIDQALLLPNHTLTGAGEDGEAVLRPEFSRLWNKFRIGKTTFTYNDPVTGEPVEARVTRCDSCHAEEPLLADDPIGLTTSREIMHQMHEITSTTARAERVLLQARRGGVETREALLEIDQAVDAHVELQVLVHDFQVGDDSEFVTKQAAGLDHALAGLKAGAQALDELAYRRTGLIVSLGIIVLLLVALALKIRQVSAH
jgi:hypothetical protein